MNLKLKESNAVAGLAEVLYDFLPWSGNVEWKGHVSFKSVTDKVGLGDFWEPGSKLPMISALLRRTLEERRGSFERLILEVVRAAITYRQKQRRPITPDEIEQLNGLILEVGFKFPDLWDPDLLASLRMDSSARAKERVSEAIANERLKAGTIGARKEELTTLRQEFFQLQGWQDRQAAGLALENILNRLFALHGLAPREPFRVVGEQIDGSCDLDYETYLLEAKWEREPLPEAPLLVLRGKIEGKSAYTRGIFIALNGISEQARVAITTGKQPTFFVVDGYDLNMILADEIGLVEFLRQRRRLLAEEGLVVVPFKELWAGSRGRQ